MRSRPFASPLAAAPAQRQRGVSLISAIFLLLLFAALAAYMVSLTNTANATSAQDINGLRAQQAAQAGLEWGAYQVLIPLVPSCVNSTTLPATVNDFSVTVTCTSYGPFTEAGSSFSLYRLTSTATSAVAVGQPGFAERQVVGTLYR